MTTSTIEVFAYWRAYDPNDGGEGSSCWDWDIYECKGFLEASRLVARLETRPGIPQLQVREVVRTEEGDCENGSVKTLTKVLWEQLDVREACPKEKLDPEFLDLLEEARLWWKGLLEKAELVKNLVKESGEKKKLLEALFLVIQDQEQIGNPVEVLNMRRESLEENLRVIHGAINVNQLASTEKGYVESHLKSLEFQAKGWFLTHGKLQA
ncbi:MAG: hypothetical protein WC824_12125 [Bacteroidota bacterium]|jgi:hypothetical protein